MRSHDAGHPLLSVAVSATPELWIGLVEAVPGDPRPDDIDEDIGGAFTTFVCMAPDQRGFRATAAHYFHSEGWRLVGVEDVEPLSHRLATARPAQDLMETIERVRRTGQPDTADEWDVYPVEDDE